MLEAQNLSCRRGGRVVFRDFSFAADTGSLTLVTGANGAGKSTLLRLLAGLLSPAAGRISWLGGEALPPLHYIGHLDAVKNGVSVLEMLDYWRALRGGSAHDMDALLRVFALQDLAARPVQRLSAGQRRRLSLTRLLLEPVPLWLLDEPVTALDQDARDALRVQIAHHRAQGGIVIAASHEELHIPDAQILASGCCMRHFCTLLHHEMRLQARHKAEWAGLLLFFIIVIMLMPFALGPEPDLLRRLAPGLVWIAALLMGLLSLDRLFVQDARDGTLDLMLTSGVAFELIVAAKLAAQILAMLVCLIVLSLPAALLLGMDLHALPVLLATFLLGVPSLILLGGIAGSITVALNRNAALLTLLLIPFYLPVVIFAVSACDAGSICAATQPLLFLAALLVLLLPAATFIIAGALRQGQE